MESLSIGFDSKEDQQSWQQADSDQTTSPTKVGKGKRVGKSRLPLAVGIHSEKVHTK